MLSGIEIFKFFVSDHLNDIFVSLTNEVLTSCKLDFRRVD